MSVLDPLTLTMYHLPNKRPYLLFIVIHWHCITNNLRNNDLNHSTYFAHRSAVWPAVLLDSLMLASLRCLSSGSSTHLSCALHAGGLAGWSWLGSLLRSVGWSPGTGWASMALAKWLCCAPHSLPSPSRMDHACSDASRQVSKRARSTQPLGDLVSKLHSITLTTFSWPKQVTGQPRFRVWERDPSGWEDCRVTL